MNGRAPKEMLIVDGYNMIGAWEPLQKLSQFSLEEARDQLLAWMSEYQAFAGVPVTVVFDAYFVPGVGGKYEFGKVQVLFTKERETADQAIERIVVEQMGRRKQIYVATSDMMEQHVIFGKGALRLPAGELWTLVLRARKEIKQTIESEIVRVQQRNTVDSKLSDEARALFEQWRRGGK